MAALRCALLFVLLLSGLARADEFSDFRIPEHRWRSIRGDAWISGERDRLGNATDQSRSGGWLGQLGVGALWAMDSDDRQWLASIDLSGFGTQYDSENSSVFPGGVGTEIRSSDLESDQVGERVVLNGEFLSYPASGPIGLGIGGNVVADFQQVSEERVVDDEFVTPTGSFRSLVRSTSDQDDYNYAARLHASVAVGRVRDATGVYRAYLLERRLRADGLMTGTLSPGARARLAQLFYLEPRYFEVHDTPGKFFWRDVEKLLREDGVLASGTLDAYALLHALEGYTAGAGYLALRQRGYQLSGSVSYDHGHRIIRQDVTSRSEFFEDGVLTSSSAVSSGNRNVGNQDAVLFGPEAQVRVPIGWRWQVDALGFARFNAKGPDKSTTVGSSFFVRYLIAERWAATGSFAQRRDTGSEHALITPEWSASSGVVVAYYFEDGLRAGLSLEDRQSRSSGVLASWSYSRDQRVLLTLSYLFSGGLDAPGLIDPVRPLRGGTLNP